MTEFFETLHSHRSIRKYRSDVAIPEASLKKILEAATRASSSGNMQAYSIIVTTSRQLRERLYEPHFQQSMVLEAPALLTFCADFRRMRRWLKLSEAPDNFDNFMSFMIATIDAVLASQNAALAAESLGFGICYLGTTLASCSDVARILQCPPGVVPVVGFTLGVPDEKPDLRERLPLSALVHRETYQDPSDESVQDFYQEKNRLGLRRALTQRFFERRWSKAKFLIWRRSTLA